MKRSILTICLLSTFLLPATAQTTAYGFLDFSARSQKKDATLSWTVKQELGTSHYLLQRSFNGISFETIARIEARPYSNLINEYNYTDPQVGSSCGRVLYRLHCIDRNGRNWPSNILKLQFQDPEKLMVHSSGDVSNVLLLSLSHDQNEMATAVLSTQGGKVLQRMPVQLVNGTSQQTMTTQGLPAGLYTITLLARDLRIQQRFVRK